MTRQFARVAYFVGALLLVVPVVDVIVALLPITVTNARWRFGAVGLLSNAFILPLAGLLILGVTAVTSQHRRLLRALSVIAWVVCALSLGLIGMFALDALQTQAGIDPQRIFAFRMATSIGMLKMLCGAVGFALFGIAASTASRANSSPSRSPAGEWGPI
jgi:hypothetical protein